MLRREEMEGAATALTALKLNFIVPGEKREQPELKDVGVMFAMKEYCVVTTAR